MEEKGAPEMEQEAEASLVVVKLGVERGHAKQEHAGMRDGSPKLQLDAGNQMVAELYPGAEEVSDGARLASGIERETGSRVKSDGGAAGEVARVVGLGLQGLKGKKAVHGSRPIDQEGTWRPWMLRRTTKKTNGNRWACSVESNWMGFFLSSSPSDFLPFFSFVLLKLLGIRGKKEEFQKVAKQV
jgi:hypothetical protein